MAMMAVALFSHAQRFHGGVMIGGVVSQVQGDSYGGFNKFGLYGGGFVSIGFAKYFALQLEMDFIQKGSRENIDPEKEQYDSYLLRVNYIEVPLLFQATLFHRLSLEIGPAMDVLVGSYEEYNQQEVDNLVPLRTVTLSGIAGVSLIIIDHLKINYRFNMSLLSFRNGVTNGYYKRFGAYGQYTDLMSLSLFYTIK
jgi:hypothetical protein